jgi:hypothetical protein
MAKRTNETVSGTDKAKVRVVFAEVEGNNESIQEALKTMVSAMSRPVRVIAEQKPNGKAAELTAPDDIEVVDEEIDQQDEVEASQGEPITAARKVRGTGKKVDRNAGLNLVPNLNFRPAGQQALKQFIEQKGAKSDVETVVAVLYFMQQVMKLAKIGPDHVMTAFKDIGKAVPADLRATIRNIKNTKAWLSYTDIEDIRTTTQGDNFVEHDMGKSSD